MRHISADLLTRIQALNQTIYGNADPKMQATIIKAVTDLQVYTISTGELLGPIDLAMKWADLTKDPEEVWIAEVINRQAVVNVYTYKKNMDFATPDRTFTLATVGTNARVRDIAIEFDGTSPYIAWLERTTTHDTGYIIQWDGVDPATQPEATKLLEVAR